MYKFMRCPKVEVRLAYTVQYIQYAKGARNWSFYYLVLPYLTRQCTKSFSFEMSLRIEIPSCVYQVALCKPFKKRFFFEAMDFIGWKFNTIHRSWNLLQHLWTMAEIIHEISLMFDSTVAEKDWLGLPNTLNNCLNIQNAIAPIQRWIWDYTMTAGVAH